MARTTLPTHDEFSRLRLHQFLPNHSVTNLEDWEYLGHLWVGEANGFTTVLQLDSDQARTRSVEVDLDSLPTNVASRLLAALGLPLRPGMSLKEIVAELGEPVKTSAFAPDRVTAEFEVSEPRYCVSCTVMHEAGLTFATMLAPLPDRG